MSSEHFACRACKRVCLNSGDFPYCSWSCRTIDTTLEDRCAYCNAKRPNCDLHFPYCSTLCAIRAEQDI